MMGKAEDAAGLTSGQLVKRLTRSYLAPRWPVIAGSFVFAAVFAALAALLVKVLQPAINDITSLAASAQLGVQSRQSPRDDHIHSLIALALQIIAIAIAKGAAQIAQTTLVNRLGSGVVGDFQANEFM